MTFHFPFDYGFSQKSGFSSVLLIFLNCLLSDPIFLVLVSFGRSVGTFLYLSPHRKRKQNQKLLWKPTNLSDGISITKREAIRGINWITGIWAQKESIFLQIDFSTFLIHIQAPLHHFKGEISWLQIEGNQICGCCSDCRFSYSDQSFYAMWIILWIPKW